MLILRPGALGDTLLAVPALRALRRRWREPLRVAGHAAAVRLLANVGEIDEGLPFDDRRLGWLFRVGERVGDERIVAWLEPSLVPGLGKPWVLAPSRPPAMDVHCAVHLLRSVGETELDARPLNVPPLESDEVLIHPGSGSPAKNWPPERFAEVIRALGDAEVRLIVGEADADAAARVDLSLGRSPPRLERLTLAELAARLAGCRAYLGNDSGISHLAGLVGARTVAMFGPTSPAVWGPLGPRVTVHDFETLPEQIAAELSD